MSTGSDSACDRLPVNIGQVDHALPDCGERVAEIAKPRSCSYRCLFRLGIIVEYAAQPINNDEVPIGGHKRAERMA